MSVSIWEERQLSKAPVMVWIHGGGFVVGWKDEDGRGEGLVLRSLESGSQGVISVSINYRLGLFVCLFESILCCSISSIS